MGKKASVRRSLAAFGLFLTMSGTALSATTAAADPDQQALDLYNAAGKSATSLAGWQELGRLQTTVKDDSARSFIRQIRAMLSSELGLYEEAVAEFPFRTNKAVAAGPLPAAGYHVADAVDAIAQLARGRRVVIVNEAHHVPQTRVLLLELLPRLRKMGFTDYAAETLDSNAGTAIAQRGYAVRKDGVYAREPVFGQLLRTVARLGYRIDSYEATATKSIQERETTQASNLAKLLSEHPDARLIVHVGYTHVREGKTPERTPMAAELKRLAGIDPLTIDQTMFTADIPAARENPAYRQLLSRLPSSQIAAAVFVTANGTPWSYEPGQYDVSAILPAPPPSHGRPGWLWAPVLQRQPFDGYADLCHSTFPCEVSARVADENVDAVPSDAIVLRKADGAPSLALPPGNYHLVAIDAQDRTLGERVIHVATSHSDAFGN